MKDIIVQLFGNYTPVTYITDAGQEIIPSGAAGCDWEFILGVALFALCLYSLFRILGSFAKRF